MGVFEAKTARSQTSKKCLDFPAVCVIAEGARWVMRTQDYQEVVAFKAHPHRMYRTASDVTRARQAAVFSNREINEIAPSKRSEKRH